MFGEKMILASASPRRREILQMAGMDFTVCVSDVDESVDVDASPCELVCALAQKKAEAVAAQHPGKTILGADTIVCIDGAALGKPKDRADAHAMLRKLSGRKHEVFTGFCILRGGQCINDYEQTAVYFRELEEAEISWYLDTGEPFDKAGAYAIQGKGGLFIRRIEGDYYNVVGLPICRIATELNKFTNESEE